MDQREVFGSRYGSSDIAERGDARKFPYFSSSDSVESFRLV